MTSNTYLFNDRFLCIVLFSYAQTLIVVVLTIVIFLFFGHEELPTHACWTKFGGFFSS